MLLDIDAGNTRIKWCLRAGGDVDAHEIQASGVIASGIEDSVPALVQSVLREDTIIKRVRVASVRNASFSRELLQAADLAWGVAAEFAAVTRECAGVRNAYPDPSRMGIDRWLAMIAAYRRAGGACCIVDCGSAIKLDVVDASGNHSGGYIVPGLVMQRRMLADSTARIILADMPDWGSLEPGCDTESAVSHGILSMVVAWLAGNTFVQQASRDGALYLAGGDVPLLAPWLKQQGLCWQAPTDLVLDGLQLALP